MIFTNNYELETAHLEEDPHRHYRVSSRLRNYVDDTYHRMGVRYQEKVRIHKVVHSAYFEEYRGGYVRINNAIAYSALRQIPQKKNFDDIFIPSGSTMALLSSFTPATRRILSPLSKTIYQDINNKINTKMNIGQVASLAPFPRMPHDRE